MLLETEAFSYQAFKPIAAYCGFDLFFRDCQTEPWMVQVVIAGQNSKVRRASTVRLLEDMFVIFGS
ncbi:hypothetical protein KY46_18465 [Photobacterium halotolerans]|uniref:Uncharacterized protein n=1 Tax=Photobacterium halotolerans TaxID=265726 RepID=A0A0F5V8K4_9GAMM|nr:hypothetical protein KY46_18465 [Photobacterium halotolerans]